MEEYIRQSENQRKTGLILLGAGLGAVAIGSAIGATSWWDDESTFEAGLILFTAGSISTLVSIPVLISSASTGRKAGRLSLTASQVPGLQPGGFSSKAYPALSFSFPLNSKKP